MYLKEPRRKKRANSQPQIPLPIHVGKNNEWIVYTAHLGESSTCIVEPQEMIAVYSMGFFGKGSLSRSFPSFGTRKYGAPPLIRERQWKCRQQWLEEVNALHSEALSASANAATEEEEAEDPLLEKNSNENINAEIQPMEIVEESTETDKSKVEDSSATNNKSKEVDEIILDSAEEEEIYEITDRAESAARRKLLDDDEIFVLSGDNDKLNADQPYEFYDISQDADINNDKQVNLSETLVLPDSDSDTENYLNNVKPRIETEGFPVTETLQLTFEETFFLMYGLGCLQLADYDGKLMSIVETWNHFINEDKHFLPRYIVYHYFRSKGWVVKPALQFGADFVLYKQGPPIYHASYIVIVEVVDADNLLIDYSKTSRKINWNSIIQMNRLSETAAKELLIAQILWPSSIPTSTNSVPLDALSEFTVREVLWRRWKPNQTDELISLEDEDDTDEDSS